MRVAKEHPPNALRLESSAAEVVITRVDSGTPTQIFEVAWKVIQFYGHEEVAGRIRMDRGELGTAFGRWIAAGNYVENWLTTAFGGDVAAQGKFIRSEDHLNIPCPGTGHDGDPNVSIFLSEEIRAAVYEFMG